MKTPVIAILATVCLWAQQPQVENARLETRAFNGSLASQVSSLGAGPFWTAWSEPIIPGQHGDMCGNEHAAGAPVRLEGQTSLVVLVRMEKAQVDRIRVASLDCRFDAGGLPFYWLTAVPPTESVNWLKAQVAGSHANSAIFAIGLHATNGVEVLKQMLASDPRQKVREQAVFALSQSKDPAGMAAVIDAAKNDKDAQVRGKALFWLAQKAANKEAQAVISNAVLNDPDRAVKEQAVFALQQLPEGQGVPLLINVAKNNPDPAVRKKAMFWLGQSKDPRALDFFVQVLKP